ncbi:PAS domain S-box protein [Deinococcus hopiensis]|uniref:PAS domain S-box protein n=1 Tax=Deinococcus hopiensis TaxID=309885 RepID=UPI0014823240
MRTRFFRRCSRTPPEPIGRAEGLGGQGRRSNSADHLAAIARASHDSIVGTDLHHTSRSWNAGATRLSGYTAAEAIGQPITLFVPPEWQADSTSTLSKIAEGERIEASELTGAGNAPDRPHRTQIEAQNEWRDLSHCHPSPRQCGSRVFGRRDGSGRSPDGVR